MILPLSMYCDVLVAGSGIAGLMAALEAAEAGCTVRLLTSTKLFSGSSFYPGTWGLGLIGPEDESDRADLCKSIQRVGCNMASPEMVETFVNGIAPAIEKVRTMGVRLRRAAQKDQREFIPCFDHKKRDWNGLEFDSVREVFTERIQELGVQVLENCEVVQLVKQGGRICGCVVFQNGTLRYLGCGSLVLATGGYGSLFRYHLCTADVAGIGQGLALDAGCSLVNMEFMQMMPGYIQPAPKTVFNEKTFRFVHIKKADGEALLPEDAETQHLLDLRSGHGPFTTRLDSKRVDLAIFEDFLRDQRGVEITYSDELRRDPPEFVTTYFDWLKQAKGLTVDDPVHVGIFAHAANGGIRITQDAFTGVSGLYACGEVTGGMHGADRIGGLSTANGLVFGIRAGRAAAKACCHKDVCPDKWEVCEIGLPEEQKILPQLQQLMYRSAMIGRNEEALADALGQLQAMENNFAPENTDDAVMIARYLRTGLQLKTARSILSAARLRRESRGSHSRTDYPEQDVQQEKQIYVTLKDDMPCAYFSDMNCG